jgi:predicted O-methyltransferase YrrM
MVISFLKFLLKSKNEHSLHSPFVFDLYTNVIQNKRKESVYTEIEKFRDDQINNHNSIEIQDFGAGSKLNKSNVRKISEIAKNAEKAPKFGQLLYRLVSFFQPKTIFDLGTSLGITTLYLSKSANTNSIVYTFEGCPNTAKVAEKLFEKAEIQNVEQIIGNIDETLQNQLAKIDTLDFVFFDANHRYEPTIRYFNQCLKKANEQTVFVFDDVHWSAEMEQAWDFIKNHQEVMISLDLFFIGIVFFRKNQPKQHFDLRF